MTAFNSVGQEVRGFQPFPKDPEGGRDQEFGPNWKQFFPSEQNSASHLSQSATDTADPKPKWPSEEEQMKYWETHDHGGNFLPSRIEANEERYGE